MKRLFFCLLLMLLVIGCGIASKKESNLLPDWGSQSIAQRKASSEALKKELDENGVFYRTFEIDEDGYCHIDCSGHWDDKKQTHIKSSFNHLDLLKGSPVKTLDIGATRVNDLSPIRGLPLTKLDLYDTPIEDLSPLSGMQLKWLRLYFTKVTDISPLKGMPLETFLVPRGARDLSVLKDMPLINLHGLFCLNDKTMDLEFLRDMKTLKQIDNDPVSAFFMQRELKSIEEKLGAKDGHSPSGGIIGVSRKELRIMATREEVKDISPVADLELETVWLWKTGVSDISPLAGMPLKTLAIYASPVKDLSPIKGMPLEFLQIGIIETSDFSVLKGLPLRKLLMWGCAINDLSPLEGMPLEVLDLNITEPGEIIDLTPLKGMNLKEISFPANTIKKGMEIIRNMKSLTQINQKSPEDFWKQYDANTSKTSEQE